MPNGMCGSEARRLIILRKRAFLKQKGHCYWCGILMVASCGVETNQQDPRLCTGDHLVPRHAGGQTIPGNIVAACKKCNNERHPELNRPRGYRETAAIVYSSGGEPPPSPLRDQLAAWAQRKEATHV